MAGKINSTKASKARHQKIVREKAQGAFQASSSKGGSDIFKVKDMYTFPSADVLIFTIYSFLVKAFSAEAPSTSSFIQWFLNLDSSVLPPSYATRIENLKKLYREHEQLKHEMEVEKKRHAELKQIENEKKEKGCLWYADVNDLTLEQLQEFMSELAKMKAVLTKRVMEDTKGKTIMQAPNANINCSSATGPSE